jgi:alkylated DNA repair dioxygenase AlkB
MSTIIECILMILPFVKCVLLVLRLSDKCMHTCTFKYSVPRLSLAYITMATQNTDSENKEVCNPAPSVATRSSSNTDTETKLEQITSVYNEISPETALEMLISCNGKVAEVLELLGPTAAEFTKSAPKSEYQSTLKRFVDQEPLSFSKKLRTDVKGKTIHIFDPEQVEHLVPCTMKLKVFPPDLADKLLQFLLEDSQTWTQNQFYMFERQVASHHTTAFYTDNETILREGATYNGNLYTNMHPLNEVMIQSRDIIQDIVNDEIKQRGLAKFQYPGRWTCDVVLTNRYSGPTESVGYHSDQLTHLGPDCVIASVSLGVTREFRLKNKHDSSTSTFSIHLPHNSLIVMHAGCQELYKHSLVANSGNLTSHPIAGQNRINLTYRMYLKEFSAPRIPKCDCDYPMILRTTIKKSSQKDYKYIWQCSGGYRTGKTCAKLLYPDFATLYKDLSDG